MEYDDIKTALREIADGVRSDMFKSYEAINLLQVIGANAPNINDSGFGIFFGRFQLILQEQIILLLSKIFEAPNRYPVKSIPAMIKFIEKHQQEFVKIELKDKTVLVLLEKYGYKTDQQDNTITEILCKYSLGKETTRERIRTLRDKTSAHHEQVDVNTLPDVSLAEIMELLDSTKVFLSIIDSAYLGISSVDNEGRYFANSESKTASLILKNLLVKANIIDVKKGREIAKTLSD
jgi:hypothetical protein